MRLSAGLSFGLVALPWAAVAAPPMPAASDAPAPRCEGAYADDFAALSVQTRTFARQPDAVFSHCTRNTAVYECLSYGADGAVRRERKRAVLHGTAFAYRRQGADTLLVTNDHVASWPAVTDPQHAVDGIPSGCKKVSETLALVDDEHDSYLRDDVAVTRVVTDPQLDIAVLRTAATLPVMPWKIGHSAALRERNVVEVRGFPLGAFRATNVGKVISPHDHDDFGDWDHDDFVIDALLSAGNSGSPVLAVSCASGEYELVGVYHAGYTAGSALNVVVGIDEVRDLLTTLKRTPHPHRDEVATADQNARAAIDAALGPQGEMFFPFGAQVAAVRAAGGGALLFQLFQKDFPSSAEPALVIEDRLGGGAGFGEAGRVWFGAARGLRGYDRSSLDGEGLAETLLALDALRADAAGQAAYRAASQAESTSRQKAEQLRRVGKSLARTAASRADLAQSLDDLAERLSPQAPERGLTLAGVLAAVASPAAPSSPAKLGPPPPHGPAAAAVAAAGLPTAAPKPILPR